jgi:hypothetical protein
MVDFDDTEDDTEDVKTPPAFAAPAFFFEVGFFGTDVATIDAADVEPAITDSMGGLTPPPNSFVTISISICPPPIPSCAGVGVGKDPL